MRLVTLLAVLILTVSCGKDGGSNKSASAQNAGGCQQNGRAVDCQSIQGADGNGVDLLDSMIDVPARINGTEITFLSDKTSMTKGRRISCDTTVKNGEIYRVALRGNTLLVMTSKGNYEMTRTSDGDSLNGGWASSSYTDTGAHVIRHMTIIGNNRVIMRTSCEL